MECYLEFVKELNKCNAYIGDWRIDIRRTVGIGSKDCASVNDRQTEHFVFVGRTTQVTYQSNGIEKNDRATSFFTFTYL